VVGQHLHRFARAVLDHRFGDVCVLFRHVAV
jgi:hypothetical protein